MAGTVAAAAAITEGLGWTPASTYDDGVLVPEEFGEGVAFVGDGFNRLENPEFCRCIDGKIPKGETRRFLG